MSFVVDNQEGKLAVLDSKIVSREAIKPALSKLAWDILQILIDKPNYPKEISRLLKVHEQKVYYHIKKLREAGLIEEEGQTIVSGALTKIYSLSAPSFSITLKKLEPSRRLSSSDVSHEKFLSPFIKAGKLNAKIVIGSPEPHGPRNTRARDVASATSLALFLGSFLNSSESNMVKLDTEIRGDALKDNLILIGGPGVNAVTEKINPHLPIFLKKTDNYYSGIHSSISKKDYVYENQGIIVKIPNPFAPRKKILVIAGRRAKGTEASVLALTLKLDEIVSGNSTDPKKHAKVVEGYDENADGVMDSVRVLE
jgi:DNA-binding transcriptional ArsR family regulator